MEQVFTVFGCWPLTSAKKVYSVMKKYEQDASFANIPARDLKYLPTQYYFDKVPSMELRRIWTQLPFAYQQSKMLQMKLPCLEHYNNDCAETHFDGPPPPKMHCIKCTLEKK